MRANPELVEGMLRQVPLRRFIAPHEIAAGMVFLASEGGKAVTGKTIVMEAGEQGPWVGPVPEA
jgi:NAD(P)-dependent dehydrogenase (short-subunit alcohol dehydrogenase family)